MSYYCNNFVMDEGSDEFILRSDAPDAFTMTQCCGGGGGGAVDSVNGKTGVVVLDADDLAYDENTTYSADTVGEALTSLSNAITLKAAIIQNTASGSIANFVDGADSMPITSLVANIEPVQDLNGYDNPWSAGGGKNIFDEDSADWKHGYFINSSGEEMSDNKYKYCQTYFPISAETQIAVQMYKGAAASLGLTVPFYDSNKNFISRSVVASASSGTGIRSGVITTPSGAAYYRMSVPDTSTSNIQVEIGNEVTSYAPYKNICPISGWTKCRITDVGSIYYVDDYKSGDGYVSGSYLKNDGTTSSGGNYYISAYIPVPANTYCKLYNANVNSPSICFYDNSKTFISGQNYGGQTSRYITTPNNCAYVRISNITGGNRANLEVNYSTQIITFPDSAGTVYGGTLNVLTGILTVTDANIASYAGETLPSTWISDRDVYAEGTTPTTGAQVVYKVSTPTTYQLTAEEISTIYGENNIWQDTGSISVTYYADTKLYIDNAIATAIAAI